MKVKIKLNDLQLNKRYLVDIEDTSAPKSNRNRRHFSIYGMLGSDVKSMLEKDSALRITSIEEQIIDVTPETSKKLTDLYEQTCELIEAYDAMDKLIQKEMATKPDGYDVELANLYNKISWLNMQLIKVCNFYAHQIHIAEPKYVPESWW
jgi:hypothetical protein